MASSRKSPKSSSLLARVSAVLERHVRRGDRLVVGLSGGIDSVVLLDLLQRAARRRRFELAALHVNHQIHPAARAWAKFCRALCRRQGIPLSVKTVEVPRGNSLEAGARAARYEAYAAARCDAVVLAHNLDDQAETLLLQLLRGAGVKGASAMPEFRIEDRGLRIELAGSSVKRRGAKDLLNPQSSVLNHRYPLYVRITEYVHFVRARR
jgi:tRNA(Ile)-lysidine synthase